MITPKKRKSSFHLLLADLKSSQVAHFESPAPTFPGIPPPPPLLLHSLLLSTIFYIIILSSVSTNLLSLGIILLVFIVGSRSKYIVVKMELFYQSYFLVLHLVMLMFYHSTFKSALIVGSVSVR